MMKSKEGESLVPFRTCICMQQLVLPCRPSVCAHWPGTGGIEIIPGRGACWAGWRYEEGLVIRNALEVILGWKQKWERHIPIKTHNDYSTLITCDLKATEWRNFGRQAWASPIDELAVDLSLSVSTYRRDWLIGACAYRLQQQENMCLLYVCAY